MRLTILDGDARGPGTWLDRAIETVAAEARDRGDECQRLRLSELDFYQCVGCFDCWLKTPGRCRLRDQGAEIVAAAAQADLVVLASPMRMGFTSALLKRAAERMSLPLLLPYIEVVDGECHHPMRYGRSLDLALLLERQDATFEELRATERIYRRLAKNLRGDLVWVRLDVPLRHEEVHDEVDAA